MSDLWNWNDSITANYYTFLVTGTINTVHGVLTPNQRFEQTLETFRSIIDKVPNAKIIYVDNSIEPLSGAMVDQIDKLVTMFRQMPHNAFSIVANIHRWKSPGEANMLHFALSLAKNSNLVGKRIFKLAGRYKLSEGFDIREYEDPRFKDKYAFLPKGYNLTADDFITSRHVWFLEQTLISFDPSLLEEFSRLLIGMTHYMISTDACIEETMAQFIPMGKTLALEKVYVEGLKADDCAEKKE